MVWLSREKSTNISASLCTRKIYKKSELTEKLEFDGETNMRDIQFQKEHKRFNCRVNGICIKDNNILLSKLKDDNYWTFVGGKV